jgi:hypothetical protein
MKEYMNNPKYKYMLKFPNCSSCGEQLTTNKSKYGLCHKCIGKSKEHTEILSKSHANQKNPNKGKALPLLRGENANHWTTGYSVNVANDRLRDMARIEYKLWRKSVFERDNHTCVICNSTENIETHHIKSWHNFPELRYAIDNGVTLCRPCHLKTDNHGKKVKWEVK